MLYKIFNYGCNFKLQNSFFLIVTIFLFSDNDILGCIFVLPA